MIERNEAWSLLKGYLKEPENLENSIVVEAIMRLLSKRLNENETLWGLVGLLHNLDCEYTQENPEKRGFVTAEILKGMLPTDGINAILSTNYIHTDVLPTSTLDKCLIASNSVCRLIKATLKSNSEGRNSDINLKMLINRYNDESFAKEVKRERIKLCSDCDLTLEEFFNLSIKALENMST